MPWHMKESAQSLKARTYLDRIKTERLNQRSMSSDQFYLQMEKVTGMKPKRNTRSTSANLKKPHGI